MKDPTLLTAERLREILRYDPGTGQFACLVTRSNNGAKAGAIAGTRKTNGYVYIQINHRMYLAHRLAWLYMTGEWPSREVDHEDTDPSNNRWSNLRLATSGENSQNQRRPGRRNTSGYLGVSYDKSRGKYAATIGLNGRTIHLGRHDTPEEAHAAYVKAKRELHPFGTI